MIDLVTGLGGVALSLGEILIDYVIPFLVALTVLVFVHELGHYLVARWCGVRVEVFSIGFGPEIYGWNDARATRWRFSAIPIGGYVKMFGEMTVGPESGDADASEEERRISFHTKSLWRRAAIVAAGPLANFLFAIVILAAVFAAVGEPSTPAKIAAVVPDSAAERAGFKPDDLITRIDGTRIERFEQVVRIVRIAPGERLRIEVERDRRTIVLTAVPDAIRQTNSFGMSQVIGRLGVSRSGGSVQIIRHDPATAIVRAVDDMFSMIGDIFQALGQMFSGTRDASELGGPLRIAQISGDVWQVGGVSTFLFLAALSVNLGLINLFPIPMLDGGHLMFYAIETVVGRPLGQRAQEYSYRLGLAMVFALMVFVTWNDLVHLKVFEFFVGLVT